MATSPIYGWLEPDNSDLVKNGALAIRTLGNAIDTTMATMTPKSIVDAKGDLIAASAADTPARLAVGNNGETLVADSSTSTGLRYTAGNPIPNPTLNSCFDIWQRGTSIAVPAGGASNYTADRWLGYRASTGTTVSRQLTSDTTNLPNVQYCARVQRTAGDTSTNTIQINNPFESANSIPLAGKTITVSFYARKGANFSEASSNLTLYGTSGTGTDQNPVSGLTGASTFLGITATLTTTWQRFSSTATMASNATQLNLQVFYTPTGTAGAADFFEITGVQVDIGSVALPVRRNGATLQGELSAAQRYYWRSPVGPANGTHGVGMAYGTTGTSIAVPLPVQMRVAPTSVDFASLTVWDTGTLTAVTGLTLNAGQTSFNTGFVNPTVASGLTQYRTYFLFNTNSNGYIGFNAEL